MASVEVGGRGALELAERSACELEEGFVVALEGVCGQGREGLAQPGVRSLEQADFLCRRRPGGLELRADPRALLARGEQLFLQPGPRSVALGQQGRELCGASSVEHAPDNRRGRDGDEQGDQRQIQVHDGRFTTLRPFFALNP